MKKLLLRVFLLGLLVPLWIFLRSIYRDRIGAFGCFDDCFNYMGGYFLLSGKRLYSEIFFNHQPILAYLSALIQYVTKPDGIYLLIYQHRMFIIYFSMMADALLVLRFGWIGFAFAVLYESTKGFLFGEHFLAEAMIIYPLVYLLGAIGEVWRRKKLQAWELIIAAIFTWFVVFSREPYIPLALVMFGYLIWKHWNIVWSKVSLGLLGILSLIVVGIHSLPDYFFNVVTVNASRLGSEGNLWSMIFYPVLVFFGGQWNLFRGIEVALVLLFWILLFFRPVPILFIFLALANIRTIAPGDMYYAAFHHLQWYGLFIMSVLLLINDIEEKRRILKIVGGIAFLGITAWAILSPQSYLHDNVDRHAEFTTNFSQIFTVGDIVKALSLPSDTLFLDGWDDLIYFQAHRYSPYKYAWYTSSMWQFERFAKAREEMFGTNPPTFYYGQCVKDVFDPTSLPRATDYVRLRTSKSPTCVFVLRSKIPHIVAEQWKKVQQYDIIQPVVE